MSAEAARAHAQTIEQIRSLAQVITPARVAEAFVASLGSRQLELRSALGSYAVARVLPDHPLVAMEDSYATICEVCGWYQMPTAREDEPIERLAAERHRFGGVRHQHPRYIEFDLSEFHDTPAVTPGEDDWERLRRILRTPALLAPTAKAADLERGLKDAVRSNKNERTVLIQILACAGVFGVPGYPSYFDYFVPAEERALPAQRFAEWGYPTIWWRAGHGVREDAVSFWFPKAAGEPVTAPDALRR